MSIIKILLLIISVSLIATIAFKFLEYLFGADKVFFIGLCSIPFLFVWCLMTDKDLDKKRKAKIN